MGHRIYRHANLHKLVGKKVKDFEKHITSDCEIDSLILKFEDNINLVITADNDYLLLSFLEEEKK